MDGNLETDHPMDGNDMERGKPVGMMTLTNRDAWYRLSYGSDLLPGKETKDTCKSFFLSSSSTSKSPIISGFAKDLRTQDHQALHTGMVQHHRLRRRRDYEQHQRPIVRQDNQVESCPTGSYHQTTGLSDSTNGTTRSRESLESRGSGLRSSFRPSATLRISFGIPSAFGTLKRSQAHLCA
jgi:hypothetical protein